MEPNAQELAATLSRLAAVVLREKTLADDLGRLTRLTMKLNEPATGMSIALLVDGVPTSAAASDRVAIELDLIQNAEAEGPCILALDGRSVRVALLATDERFPHFAIGAADRRIQSVLSTPIFSEGETIGTMNIYSRHPDAFNDDHEATSAIIATAVANAIEKSKLLTDVQGIRDRLQVEFDDAAIINRARGVLMGFEQCSVEQADALLNHAARVTPESVVEVAERVLRVAQADSITSDDPPTPHP
jgi:GAF domain-containing protein